MDVEGGRELAVGVVCDRGAEDTVDARLVVVTNGEEDVRGGGVNEVKAENVFVVCRKVRATVSMRQVASETYQKAWWCTILLIVHGVW